MRSGHSECRVIERAIYDPKVIPILKRLAILENQLFRFCTKCGIPFITSPYYHKEDCIICTGDLKSMNVERRNIVQRNYGGRNERND